MDFWGQVWSQQKIQGVPRCGLIIHVYTKGIRVLVSIKTLNEYYWLTHTRSIPHQQSFKLVNNRWAWGRCLERWWGWSLKPDNPVSSNHQALSDWKMLNDDTCLILTREGGGHRGKSSSIAGMAKMHVRMGWPQQPINYKTMGAPPMTSIVLHLT